MITSLTISINAVVSPLRENVVARLENNDFRFVHTGQRLVVIALGMGFAICRREGEPQSELLSIQTEDVEVLPR